MKSGAVNHTGWTEQANWLHGTAESVESILSARLFDSATTLALENRRLIQAMAIQQAQREHLNWELQDAREVQQRLLPQGRIEVDGLECAGHCRPAESVGGDFFDFLAVFFEGCG